MYNYIVRYRLGDDKKELMASVKALSSAQAWRIFLTNNEEAHVVCVMREIN